jgi:putative sterol carrier protein
MADSITGFFEGLSGRGHEPLLEKASGSLRLDVTDGKKTERWLLEIHRGDLAVSRRNVRADCVVRGDRALFERIASGRQNAMAALLRGAIEVEGNVGLLVLFQKLLPGPPRSRRNTAGYAKRTR